MRSLIYTSRYTRYAASSRTDLFMNLPTQTRLHLYRSLTVQAIKSTLNDTILRLVLSLLSEVLKCASVSVEITKSQ